MATPAAPATFIPWLEFAQRCADCCPGPARASLPVIWVPILTETVKSVKRLRWSVTVGSVESALQDRVWPRGGCASTGLNCTRSRTHGSVRRRCAVATRRPRAPRTGPGSGRPRPVADGAALPRLGLQRADELVAAAGSPVVGGADEPLEVGDEVGPHGGVALGLLSGGRRRSAVRAAPSLRRSCPPRSHPWRRVPGDPTATNQSQLIDAVHRVGAALGPLTHAHLGHVPPMVAATGGWPPVQPARPACDRCLCIADGYRLGTLEGRESSRNSGWSLASRFEWFMEALQWCVLERPGSAGASVLA
jgi:hypothetical protein